MLAVLAAAVAALLLPAPPRWPAVPAIRPPTPSSDVPGRLDAAASSTRSALQAPTARPARRGRRDQPDRRALRRPRAGQAELDVVGDPAESGRQRHRQASTWTGRWPTAWSGSTRPGAAQEGRQDTGGSSSAGRRPPAALAERQAPQGPAAAAERGSILDGAGQPLVTPGRWSWSASSRSAGHEPGRRCIPRSTPRSSRSGSRSTWPTCRPGSTAAKPDAFVEVVTLRREVYDQIRAQIRDLPGTVFRESDPDAGPDPYLRPGAARHGRRRDQGADGRQPGQVRGRRPGRPVGPAGGVRRPAARRAGRQVVDRRPQEPDGTGSADRSCSRPTRSRAAAQDHPRPEGPERGRRGPGRPAHRRRWSPSGSATARSWPSANGPDGGAVNLAFTASGAARLDVQDGHRARPARQRARSPPTRR